MLDVDPVRFELVWRCEPLLQRLYGGLYEGILAAWSES
jgi:hypothetical protein